MGVVWVWGLQLVIFFLLIYIKVVWGILCKREGIVKDLIKRFFRLYYFQDNLGNY